MDPVISTLRRSRDRHLEMLVEYLRIPSISTDPDRRKAINEAARFTRDRLRDAGCTRAEVMPTSGHPIVYGEWLGAPDKPTILVYGHYDVQPVDPIELWHNPPFEPVVKNGCIYARGAADDKGQLCIHINALEAHIKTNGRAPINVRFLLEGEEEIGSPSLSTFLRANKALLDCDAVVVSDTGMLAKGVPSICHGLRGLVYLQIDLVGSKHDLHSGSFGGTVVNPANALTAMLAQLKDSRGKVRIPGFYDRVRKLSPAQRRALAALPHSDTRFRRAVGAPELFGEAAFSTLERVWTRPSLDINGLWAGFTGNGAKTVIPAQAHAKISMRLVPDQRAKEIENLAVKQIKALAPRSVKVSVQRLHGGEPWLAPSDHPAMQAAGRAIQRSFGKKPVFTREGGSIPVIATFDKMLRVPAVLMGIGLPDDAVHAPNEKLDLDNFYAGTDAAAYLLDELGKNVDTAGTNEPKPRPSRARKSTGKHSTNRKSPGRT